MNLKLLIDRVADDAVSRSRDMAIKLLVRAGVDRERAKFFVSQVIKHIPLMNGELRAYIWGVIRWALEDQIDLSEDRDLSKINTLLRVLKNSPLYDEYNGNFNGLSFKEVQQALSVNLSKESKSVKKGNYTIVPISSYEQALKYKSYAPDWCILQSDEAFDDHTINGLNKFYFLLNEGWRDEEPIPGDNYPYDNYGYSMIAVSVDPDGNITSTTSRWNFDDAHDYFLTDEQLKSLLGSQFSKLTRS